ncbi:MAG: hypothetical protein H6574_06075 [Lewinellaceae bacterium]|nr:hypothetical protein [Saprospiraceae bacterium]MCB9330629.1 hypothetical protein [Lewinellaceae bacterium]
MFSSTDSLYIIPENSILSQMNGGFANRVALIVLKETEGPEYTIFLSKVLLAAGLNLEQDTLLGTFEAGMQLPFLPLAKTKQAESILVFGFTPKQLSLNIECPLYQPVDFYGLRLLFADKVSVLEPDTARKRKLWQALQQMFLNK